MWPRSSIETSCSYKLREAHTVRWFKGLVGWRVWRDLTSHWRLSWARNQISEGKSRKTAGALSGLVFSHNNSSVRDPSFKQLLSHSVQMISVYREQKQNRETKGSCSSHDFLDFVVCDVVFFMGLEKQLQKPQLSKSLSKSSSIFLKESRCLAPTLEDQTWSNFNQTDFFRWLLIKQINLKTQLSLFICSHYCKSWWQPQWCQPLRAGHFHWPHL